MVYAKVEELYKYLQPDIWKKVEMFLENVNENTPEGRYSIIEEEVFARVMSYSTKSAEECKIEAHNKYIDIQATIIGAEGISIYDRKKMCENSVYNMEKDVIFYESKDAIVNAHTANVPGYFTMLYPEDAHRPQEKIRGIEWVKKYVIKVKV